MEIQLFSRVILVDVFTSPSELIDRVLNAPDATGDGVLRDTDRVTKTPAKYFTFGGKV